MRPENGCELSQEREFESEYVSKNMHFCGIFAACRSFICRSFAPINRRFSQRRVYLPVAVSHMPPTAFPVILDSGVSLRSLLKVSSWIFRHRPRGFVCQSSRKIFKTCLARHCPVASGHLGHLHTERHRLPKRKPGKGGYGTDWRDWGFHTLLSIEI